MVGNGRDDPARASSANFRAAGRPAPVAPGQSDHHFSDFLLSSSVVVISRHPLCDPLPTPDAASSYTSPATHAINARWGVSAHRFDRCMVVPKGGELR